MVLLVVSGIFIGTSLAGFCQLYKFLGVSTCKKNRFNMMNFLEKYKLGLVGILVGGVLGYAYYHFIGCTTGTCAITSKPLNSTAYGMMMGYLMFSVFQKSKIKEENV